MTLMERISEVQQHLEADQQRRGYLQLQYVAWLCSELLAEVNENVDEVMVIE